MPNSTYLPRSDAGLLAWAAHAASVLADGPNVYSLSAAQVTAFTTAFAAYDQAMAACAKAVRIPSAVTTKNQKRSALVVQMRLLSNYVNGIATVTDAQKQDLGLTIRRKPRPVPAPSQPPVLHVVATNGRTVTLELHATTGSKRGRPAGVASASVFTAMSAQIPTEISAYVFYANLTRTQFDVTFDDSATANTAWVTAFWSNARGESGPACPPVRIDLPAAAPVPQPQAMKIAA